MKNSFCSPALSRIILAAALACGVAGLTASAIAEQKPELRALSDSQPALPLTASFAKDAGSEGGPFVLTLKNDSKATLKVSGKVLLTVVHHAMDKARNVPEQTLAPGQSMTIKELSGDDRVLLNAPGFAPLEIKVPYKL